MYYIYAVMMMFIYVGYILLNNHRMKLSEVWISKDRLTPEDIHTITQLGTWSTQLEVALLVLCIGLGIVCLIKNQHDKRSLKHYFIANGGLIAGMTTISLVLYWVTSIDLYDLLHPIIYLLFALSIVLAYMFWAFILGRFKHGLF